jgi:holo-[acyl-carrier protein] synthase
MIVGIGLDLMDVTRMELELQRQDRGFLAGLFTAGEISDCEAQRHPAQHYAARFAAKEAAFKALALGPPDGASWREAEVRGCPPGARELVLHGRLRRRADELHVKRVLLSLTHTRRLAAASVVLES